MVDLTKTSDADLQAEMLRRQQEKAAADAASFAESVAPLVAVGFGGQTMKDIIAAMEEALPTLPRVPNDMFIHANAGLMGIRELDRIITIGITPAPVVTPPPTPAEA